MNTFRVAELVTAARCPRQLVLHRLGHRVVSEGDTVVARMAHGALVHLATQGARHEPLLRALDSAQPDEQAVATACWQLAYGHVYEPALQAVSSLDGEVLGRLDSLLRSLSAWMASVLIRNQSVYGNGPETIARTLQATEERMDFIVGDVRVQGRLGLRCLDASTNTAWLWDLETHGGVESARREQVRVISAALSSGALDVPEQAAVILHEAGETVESTELATLSDADRGNWERGLRGIVAWLGEDGTPPAAEAETCRACPAQEPCWTRWGRTLPDADQAPRRSALASSSRPLPRSPSVEPSPAAPSKTEWTPPTIWIGEERGSGRAACLEPTDLTRHVAVMGAAGSGKTCLAKSIVEEAALSGIPSLVLDLRGDLAQFAMPSQGGSEAVEVRRRGLESLLEVRLLTPGSDAGLPLSLHPLWSPEGLDEETRRFCRVAMAEALLGAVRVPETWGDLAREYLAQVLETPSGSASLQRLIGQVRNPTELRGESLLRSRTRRDALAEQLRQLSEGDQRHLYERGRRLNLDELLTPSSPGKVPVNVVWLPGLGDDQSRHRFVATVLSDICAWMSKEESTAPRLLVYLDEVAPFMPPMGESSPKRLLLRILQEGRRHGVCGLFCTRTFTEVDYKVLAQLGTLLLGRLGSTQDKARVRKMLPTPGGFDPAGAAEMLTGAGVGRFLMSNVDRFGAPRVIQARMPLTLHARPWGEEQVRAQVTAEARRGW
jgi:hypothetical protein